MSQDIKRDETRDETVEKKPGARYDKPAFGASDEKPRNLWGTTKRLARYIKPNALLVALAFVVTIGGTLMQVYSPKRLGQAVTAIFDGIRSGQGVDFNNVGIILLSVAALYVGIFLANFLQQRFMVLVSQKATYQMRNELKAKMNRVPVSFFDKNASGNLMSIASNDVDNIVTNLQESLTTLISSVILVVGFFWMMMTISPALTGITCLFVPFSIMLIFGVTPFTKKYTGDYYKSLGELNTQVEEAYQGFAVVKTFNGEASAEAKFEQSNTDMVVKGTKARFIGGTMMPAMTLGTNIVYVFTAVVAALKVISGQIQIGDMTAFFQYSSGFSSPFMKILQSWGNVLAMLASSERVFGLIDADEMTPDGQNAVAEDSGATGGAARSRVAAMGCTGADVAAAVGTAASISKVSFEHVQFGYGEDLLMKDFNLDVEAGQMVAIVGHTGAGKTTLINLLERFYDISGGIIRVDGIDTRSMSRQELRRRIGMVLQDTWLFSGTIYDNILYGNEDATPEQVRAAAKAAFADDFIQKLPDGYDTILNEEADNISQGQRQLITIARAFVSNPEVLILDEATSNVDSRTEMVIQGAMKRLLEGRTSFVVAHRLSTIYGADRILVMDSGDIVETGNHEELQAMNGIYAEIYNSQFAQTAA